MASMNIIIYFINVFVAKLGTAATGNFLSEKRKRKRKRKRERETKRERERERDKEKERELTIQILRKKEEERERKRTDRETLCNVAKLNRISGLPKKIKHQTS